MSGFTDSMIDDGYSDPQDYLDYLCSKALDDDDDNYVDYSNEEDSLDEDDFIDE